MRILKRVAHGLITMALLPFVEFYETFWVEPRLERAEKKIFAKLYDAGRILPSRLKTSREMSDRLTEIRVTHTWNEPGIPATYSTTVIFYQIDYRTNTIHRRLGLTSGVVTDVTGALIEDVQYLNSYDETFRFEERLRSKVSA